MATKLIPRFVLRYRVQAMPENDAQTLWMPNEVISNKSFQPKCKDEMSITV